MSNKALIALLIVASLGVTGVIVVKDKNKPEIPRPGIAQKDNGKNHVPDGSVPYGQGEPPTSGDHGSNLPWQAYDQEVPDMNIIHNLEHGGVYISYHPDLPADQVAKIKALFTKPYSSPDFTPNKVIIAPRKANDAPIIMSSWTRSMKLEQFDEAKMKEYYLRNVGKSPEPGAG